MAVVKKETRGFNGRRIDVIVKCNAGGEFTIDYPSEVAEVLKAKCVKGGTLKEAESKFLNALASFVDRRTSTTRVILYSIKHSADVMRNDKYVFRSSVEDKDNTVHLGFDEHGTQLVIEAGVYDESVTDTADNKSYKYATVKTSIPRGLRPNTVNSWNDQTRMRRMEYTPEREAFFAMLGTAFEDLIIRLVGFTKDTNKLMLAIDAGRIGQLMLPAPEIPKCAFEKEQVIGCKLISKSYNANITWHSRKAD